MSAAFEPRPSTVPYRSDIEGLRGVAVLLVVAFHAGVPHFRGGFIGVDVFFVLSGYLITGLLLREIEEHGRINIAAFYARRIRRLLPASAVMLLATMIAGSLLLGPLERVNVARTARATAAYVSNIMFQRLANDYFAPDVESNPLLHTWSLAVEEQFYLCWPLLIALTVRFGRRSRRVVAGTLIGFAVVSFSFSLALVRGNLVEAFYSAPPRAWEFAVGGIASLLSSLQLTYRWRSLISMAGIALVLAAALEFSPGTAFPGAAALVPVFGTVAVLVCGVQTKGNHLVQALLRLPMFQLFGRLSYSWYLWHWPALVFAGVLVPGISSFGKAVAAVLAFGLAAVTYRLIENPIRHHRKLQTRTALTLGFGLILTAFGIGASTLWKSSCASAALQPQQADLAKAAGDMPLRHDGCVTFWAEAKVHECEFGEPSGAQVVVFGDSHAEQWFPAIQQIATRSHWHVTTMLKASCPSIQVPIYNPTLRRVEDECWTWREEAVRRIIRMHASLVVLSNSSGYVRRNGAPADGYSRLSYRDWEQGVESLLRTLNAAGIRTAIIRDTPVPHFDMLTCLSRVIDHPSLFSQRLCTLNRGDALDDAVWRTEQGAARQFGNVVTVDMTDRFCDGAHCAPIVEGQVVYRDTNHIAYGFAALQSDILEKRLLN